MSGQRHIKRTGIVVWLQTVRVPREDVEQCVQSGDWREVREFYLTTFDSFVEINAAFKVGS